MNTVVFPAIREELYYGYMGVWSEGYGFCFASYDGGSLWGGTIGFKYDLIEDNQIRYEYNAADNKINGDYYLANAAFANLVAPIGYGTPRTFTLSTNDIWGPE